MSKLSLALVASLGLGGLVGCADAVDADHAGAEVGGAPQQLEAGTLAGTPAKSTDPRLLNCQLEYEAFSPTFAARTATSFENTFGQVENAGVSVNDGAFGLVVSTNPNPPFNLSFIIQIFDAVKNAELSYIVLPRPHVGGAFLFELGAGIPSVTLSDGKVYDHLRAYCSIRMP
ncbi:MAG: hypothetical protein E6J90_22610 [Deltaproteobacteria bacterium]|nr:MAG: hypothetical protein E6J91_36025 [Deltaproteobacteria bacterium]TMQ17162.1 MAG: hypothetical protein E6J90_22610 [Deltaproteobacteria bacterium]